MGIEEIRNLKSGAEARKSKHSRHDNRAGGGDAEESPRKKEEWFAARHKEMTGICQCGCGNPSSRKTGYFRHSVAHIFPKRIFKSIMFHPLNWVERAFFGGCHTNMDERSIERWHLMADWPSIVRRFFILEKELSPFEKTYKFYRLLKKEVELHPV